MRESYSSILKSWLTVVASLTLLGLISPQTVLYVLKRFVLNKYWYSEVIFDKGRCTRETSSASINPKLHEKTHHRNVSGVGKLNTTVANVSCIQHQHCHTHPLCMRKWVSNHRGSIESHLHGTGYLVNSSSSEILALVHKRIGERKCSTRKAYVSVGADSGLLQHVHHIPHFSEVYFNFFSLSLWSCEFTRKTSHEIGYLNSLDAYPMTTHRDHFILTTQSHTTIDKLSIHSTSKQFWSMKEDSSSHSWIKDIVRAVNGFLGVQTIRSSLCDQNEGDSLHSHSNDTDTSSVNEEYLQLSTRLMVDGWFLHPSDAMVLGSIILKENPCRYQGLLKKRLFSQTNYSVTGLGDIGSSDGDITSLRNEMITVGLLDRSTDRKLLNAKDIMGTSKIGNKSLVMSLFTFSDKNIADQVALMRGVDVLVAVHGAGLTNIAWLKPCSILVEVFPYGYYLPYYFGPLAEKVGVLHNEWEASEDETSRKELLFERPHCAKKFKGIRKKYNNQFKRTNNTEIEKISTYSDLCLEDDLCRSCARGADGLVVNMEKLMSNMRGLLVKREKCIVQHDFL